MKILILIVSSFGLIQCGLAPTQRNVPSDGVATYDVPYQARSNKGGLKKRILVLPFLDEKLTRSHKVRDVARRTVVAELVKTNNFVIIKNSDFPGDLEKYKTEDNDYDIEKIAKAASGLGISAVLEGKILEVKARRLGDQVGLFREVKAEAETTVRLRLASSKSGKVLLNDVRKAQVEAVTTRVAQYSYSDRFLEEDPLLVNRSVIKAFRGSIGQIIQSVEKIDWEGRVAMVSGDRVFINAGRLSGIQVGDVLKVTESGQEVFDPDTGSFIGNAPGRMKGTLEVVSYFGKDGAITVVHSGSGFSENDRVELY